MWQFFNLDELKCKCGKCHSTGEEMNSAFMEKLIALRRFLNFQFPVTSAYRCSEYNEKVSSTGLRGPHTTGKAIDIGVRGEQADKLVASAYRFAISGKGIHQKGDSRFIHLDSLTKEEGFPRPLIWSY